MTESIELTPQQSFEEKIKDKIRADIGDLIPDEMLAEMVKKSIDNMFFERRPNPDRYSSGNIPSWFEEHTKELMMDRLKSIINSYMEENKEEFGQVVGQIIIDNLPALMGKLILSGFNSAGADIGMNAGNILAESIQTSLAGALQNRGLM